MTDLGSVLMIDDEEIDQKQYKRILQRSGRTQEVHQFTYADEALDWLRDSPNKQVDLIFLDINMPRMNGFEFLDAIENEEPRSGCPVILMLTTSLAPSDKNRALAHPMVRGFLSKPLRKHHLDEAAAMLNAAGS